MNFTLFKTFLLEDEEYDPEAVLDGHAKDVAAIIRKECAPFLKTAGSMAFSAYRGMEPSGYEEWSRALVIPKDDDDVVEHEIKDDAYINAVPRNREPVDSSGYYHEALNKFFVGKVGLPVRSACFFATGEYESVGHYGTPHIVLPCGDFHYTWSSRIIDAYNNCPANLRNAADVLDATLTDEFLDKNLTFSSFEKFIEHLKKVLRVEVKGELSISDASESRATITLIALEMSLDRSYPAIKRSYDNLYPLRADTDKTEYSAAYFKQFAQQAVTAGTRDFDENSEFYGDVVVEYLNRHGKYLFDSDLTGAISSGHEIMFVCNKYIALKHGSDLTNKVIDLLS